MDNTKKFTGRAEDYISGRPDYSKSLISYLYNECGFSEKSVIADIGSGTGKFSRQLLEKGSTVICVEPNDDMRLAAEKLLSEFDGFHSVNANSESTGLKPQSIDFVTTAQAFHWFDAEKFKNECKRILKPGGLVVIVYNTRDMQSEFNRRTYDIYKKYCPNFKGFHAGIKDGDKCFSEFFDDKYKTVTIPNPILFTKKKFISRSLSGSYSLKPGDADFKFYVYELENLFDSLSSKGEVIMDNNTVAYIGTAL